MQLKIASNYTEILLSKQRRCFSSQLPPFSNRNFCTSQPTACVSGGRGVGVEPVHKRNSPKLENCYFGGRIPAVRCTLCWALVELKTPCLKKDTNANLTKFYLRFSDFKSNDYSYLMLAFLSAGLSDDKSIF